VKTFLLMRHAKSSWKTSEPDFDRPLKGRGKRDAPRMGRLLLDTFGTPDLILSSSAVRARETADLVAYACEYSGPVLLRDDLYGADAEDWLRVLRQVDGDLGTVLAVGHNPAVDDLWLRLTGQGVHLTTAALAAARLHLDAWRDIGTVAPAEIVGVWRPGDLSDEGLDGGRT